MPLSKASLSGGVPGVWRKQYLALFTLCFRPFAVSALAWCLLVSPPAIGASTTLNADVLRYQTVTFSTDLATVDSVDWLVNQLAYAQILHRGDITEATLERLQAIAPDSPQASMYQAQYYAQNKRLAEAQAILAKMQLSVPNSPQTVALQTYLSIFTTERSRYQQAKLFARSGRYQEAFDAYQALFPKGAPTPLLQLEMLQLESSLPTHRSSVQHGLVQLNRAYPNVPEFQLALASHTLEDSPNDANALAALQQLALHQTVGGQASATWLKLLNNRTISADVVAQYALLASYNPSNSTYQQAYQDANARLAKEVELRKDPTYVAKRQGLVLLESGNYAAAKAKLLLALTTRPTDAETLGGLGFVHLRQGQQAKALEYFKLAKQYDTDILSVDKWDSLIAVSAYWADIDTAKKWMQQGDYTKAETTLTNAAKNQPDEIYAYLALADVAQLQQQFAKADHHYQKVIQIEPLNREALAGRLTLRQEQQGVNQALAFSQTQMSSAQRNVIMAELTTLEQQRLLTQIKQSMALGLQQQALEQLNILVETPPQSPWDKADIADVYQNLGQSTRANALMEIWAQEANIQSRNAQSDAARELNAEMQFAYALYLSRYGQLARSVTTLEQIAQVDRTPAMQTNLQRLKRDLAFAQLAPLIATQPDVARLKIATLRREYRHDLSTQIRLISLEAQLGFTQEASLAANSLTPAADWSFDTQLAYGQLVLDLQDKVLFQRWQQQLPIPQGEAEQVAEQTRQRDMLFAQFALSQQDYQQALALMSPYRLVQQTGATSGQVAAVNQIENIEIEANIGLMLAYQADGQLDEASAVGAQLYAYQAQMSAYQSMQLALLLQRAGQSEKALLLVSQLESKPDADGFDYRQAMSIALENDAELLAETMATQALLAEQRTTSQQVATNNDRAQSALTQNTVAQNALGQSALHQGDLHTKNDLSQSHLSQSHLNQSHLNNAADVDRLATSPSLRQLYDNAGEGWISRSVKADLDIMHAKHDGYVTFGGDYSGKDSENSALQIPIEVSIPITNWDGHLLLRTDVSLLDSGDLAYYSKQDGQNSDAIIHAKDNGVALGVGWQAATWSADIGTTPIGFNEQTWVGGINVAGDFGDLGWKATLSRRPETSSTLSYAGMTVPENAPSQDAQHQGESWGNVVSTGIKLGGSYDIGGPVGFWSSAQYHSLTGHNVEDNSRLSLLGGTYWKLLAEDDTRFSVGLNALYFDYEKNLSEYTYGSGGYFSPQRYISLSLPVNYYQRVGTTWSYSLSAAVSHSWSQEDGEYNSIEASSKGGGLGFSLEAAIEKRVSKHWYLGAAVDIQRSDFYEPNHFLLYARYTFSDRWQSVAMPVEPLQLYAEFD